MDDHDKFALFVNTMVSNISLYELKKTFEQDYLAQDVLWIENLET